MKILIAHGEHGQHVIDGVTEFNWTQPDEIVNMDQIVCCNSPSCGCNRSFHGIYSRGKTSRAQVVEISDEQYKNALEDIFMNAMRQYRSVNIKESAAQKAAFRRKNCLVEIAKYVQDLPIGTVVTIKKDQIGDEYEMFH
jgi:hypothetical protein